jgi:hypothetical protein
LIIQNEEPEMTEISMAGPDGGEPVLTGPVRMRIPEDGSTTQHRLAGVMARHDTVPAAGFAS